MQPARCGKIHQFDNPTRTGAVIDQFVGLFGARSTLQRVIVNANIGTEQLQVAVINYESTWRLEKELAAWKPNLIIADEGHKIKTHNISASKAMHRLGAKAGYRLLLTGTPVTNKAIDLSLYVEGYTGTLAYSVLSQPHKGSVSPTSGSANVTYKYKWNYTGSTSFTYRVTDAWGQYDDGTITVSVG